MFALTVAVLADGWRAGIACAVALALAAAFYPAGLRPLRSLRLWIFITFLLIPALLLAEPKAWTIGGIALSQTGLATGTQMSFRAVTIVVSVAGFASSVSVSQLSGLLERVGIKGLGFALGVAFNMLPVIQENATNTYQALKMRRAFQRGRLKALRLLFVTVVVNSLRHADEIVNAAEARAFSTERSRPVPLQHRSSDLALNSALLVLAFVLVA